MIGVAFGDVREVKRGFGRSGVEGLKGLETLEKVGYGAFGDSVAVLGGGYYDQTFGFVGRRETDTHSSPVTENRAALHTRIH